MMSWKRWVLVLLLSVVSQAVSTVRAAGSVSEFVVYGGRYDIGKSGKAEELGIELRCSSAWADFQWVGGLAGTTDSAAWVYAGGRYPFALNERWQLAPGFAVAVYEEGDGKDLGGAIEFRSSLEISLDISARSRIGLVVHHLSNAGIYRRNPGSNSLAVTFTFAP